MKINSEAVLFISNYECHPYLLNTEGWHPFFKLGQFAQAAKGEYDCHSILLLEGFTLCLDIKSKQKNQENI